MQINLSEQLVREAQYIIETNHPLQGPVSIPSEEKGVHAVLSPNPDDLMPLQEIKYDGTSYYLGLPKMS